MDDLTSVTLDMLINIYKTSLDYLTNGPRGPLTYNLTFKSSLESIHCIYLRMDLLMANVVPFCLFQTFSWKTFLILSISDINVEQPTTARTRQRAS